jgi:hypothetical protein
VALAGFSNGFFSLFVCWISSDDDAGQMPSRGREHAWMLCVEDAGKIDPTCIAPTDSAGHVF